MGGRGGRILAVLLVVALVVGFSSPVRTRASAAALTLDALGLTERRPFAAEITVAPARFAGVDGDLYSSPGSPPAVLLVPGAAPDGRADVRIVALAEAVARSKRAVFIPELEVYTETLVHEDVDRILRAALALEDEHGPVVLVGISFGGSLALLAAADPRLDVPVVATFGAYVDLLEVATAAIVGTSLVDGQEIPWQADARARDVVRDQLVGLLPRDARDLLRAVLREELSVDVLPEPLRAVHDFLQATTHQEAAAAIARMPREALDRLDGLSPVGVAELIEADIVALHAVDDPVIPYGELVRLGATFEDAELLTVEGFGHVDVEAAGGIFDALGALRQVWRFAYRVLAG